MAIFADTSENFSSSWMGQGVERILNNDLPDASADFVSSSDHTDYTSDEDYVGHDDLASIRTNPMPLIQKLETFSRPSEKATTFSKPQKKIKSAVSNAESFLANPPGSGFLSTRVWRIKAIFGPAAGSFFHFLLWLINLNIFNVIMICLLVVLPQELHDKKETITREDCDNVKMTKYGKNCYETANVSACCSLDYQDNLETFSFEQNELVDSVTNLLRSLFDGSGWMANTILFYGYYSGTYIFHFDSKYSKQPENI